MPDGEDFLTVAQVAALAQVSRRTVVRWIESGHLPAYRFTNSSPWRILRGDWELFRKGGSNVEKGVAYSNELAVVG